jgi:AbrB family looped-hinge helix DNA binding protein
MSVTISSKYQVVIPKDVRKSEKFKPGSKVAVIAKGGILYIVPVPKKSEILGMLKHLQLGDEPLRDKGNREL